MRLALALLISLPAQAALAAVDRPGLDRAFRQWVDGDLRAEARAAGISQQTFDAAMRGVSLDWEMPDLHPPGAPPDRPQQEHQAEFGSPGAYFSEKGLAGSVTQGRARIRQWRSTLDAVEKRYGVPAGIIVAIWARESAFGQAAIPHSAVRTLATHAFIGRRKDFFRAELIAALQILQQGDVTSARMKSSWAGALGQPQFLPSQVLRYAVDFDGDGRRDIWNSVPDTLASIAHYLREAGWNPARGWGLEARVPASVSCTLEGPEQGKPLEEWARLGVTRIDGGPLPARDGRKSFLLMPAGRHGPAFMVSENFYVLKEYNFSDLYALYVGHLADRLGDNRAFTAKWDRVGGFTRSDVRRMQLAFEREGRDVGGSDGLVGFKTRIAVGEWQAANGRPVTCFPDAAMVKGIR